MQVSLVPCARLMSYGPLPESKSARTTLRGVSLKPSAVPPPTHNLTKHLDMLATTATTATRAALPKLEDLAAAPKASAVHVVEIARVIATTTLTMLTAAYDRDLPTSPLLLPVPRRSLLGHLDPPLLPHQHQACLPPWGQVLV
jgi:hypothetical protein